MNIHRKLKWDTIINRANKLAGGEVDRFRYDDASGQIYEFNEEENAYFFVCTDLNWNKESFIENHL